MKSIWNMREPQKERDRRCLPEKVQVAVIGGGMAGILSGWLLQETGAEVVILEAAAVGSGQTGKTTAKITAQNGLIYGKLSETMGEEAAGQYARASQAAIDEYERIIREKEIRCGFTRLPAYLYTNSEEGAEKLEQERTSAIRAGLPASIVYETELPFPVHMALKLENQAQFEPLEFLYDLTDDLNVYENTKALAVDGHAITTTRGVITAEKIVFATHFPFPNRPGFYFTRMYQERSYVLALETREKVTLNGIYYGIDDGGWSFRSVGDLILMGGMGHRTGECRKEPAYDRLRQAAKEIWGEVLEKAAWSAQDCMTLDSIPYIGRFSRRKPDWLVATGFGKWGMANSMVAAMVIRGLVTGKYNQDWRVFSPQRRMVKTAYVSLFRNLGHTAKNFFVPGGPRCAHLGCRLKWNREERTWDCPCHGSRYEEEGALIDNPAKRGIKKPGPRSSL